MSNPNDYESFKKAWELLRSQPQAKRREFITIISNGERIPGQPQYSRYSVVAMLQELENDLAAERAMRAAEATGYRRTVQQLQQGAQAQQTDDHQELRQKVALAMLQRDPTASWDTVLTDTDAFVSMLQVTPGCQERLEATEEVLRELPDGIRLLGVSCPMGGCSHESEDECTAAYREKCNGLGMAAGYVGDEIQRLKEKLEDCGE